MHVPNTSSFPLMVTVCIVGTHSLRWHVLHLSQMLHLLQPSTERLRDVHKRMQGPSE